MKLSYDWRFGEVKKLACRELEKITIGYLTLHSSFFEALTNTRPWLLPELTEVVFEDSGVDAAAGGGGV